MTQIRWFQPASDALPNTNEWHAYREESPAALCGEATLSYNRDGVADEVPPSGTAHLGCREAIEAENPSPYVPGPAPEAPEETEAVAADDVAPPTTEALTDGSTVDGSTDDGSTEATTETPVSDGETETTEVTSDDVAPVASILGEPDPAAPTDDQPPA